MSKLSLNCINDKWFIDRFRATLYPCPESPAERREMAIGVMTRIEDLQTVSLEPNRLFHVWRMTTLWNGFCSNRNEDTYLYASKWKVCRYRKIEVEIQNVNKPLETHWKDFVNRFSQLVSSVHANSSGYSINIYIKVQQLASNQDLSLFSVQTETFQIIRKNREN